VSVRGRRLLVYREVMGDVFHVNDGIETNVTLMISDLRTQKSLESAVAPKRVLFLSYRSVFTAGVFCYRIGIALKKVRYLSIHDVIIQLARNVEKTFMFEL
jgi:uncharacterized protein YbcV (DUF1398 family)